MTKRAATPADEHGEHAVSAFGRGDLLRIGLVALAAGATWFQLWQPMGRVDVVALAVLVTGGWPIWREAVEALSKRRMTMELSMTIAIGAAAAIGELFTALVIVLFVLVAEMLERMTVARGRRAIQQLVELLPRNAFVRRNGAEHEVAADSLQSGDVILIRPGALIPVDGVVECGHSFVDQATITGESLPVEKRSGAEVFAGTINQSGALEVRTRGVGRDTAFGRIIESVEHAEQSRAPIEKTADRLAGHLVYFALGCAAFTFLITRDARATISVVIVAGACGIAAGTPLAILGAIGRAARIGSIIKGGLYLEALGRVDTVVLDKTGTVTFGEPEVTQVLAIAGATMREVLEAASMAERRSEHPFARAILRRAAAEGVSPGEPEKFSYQPGLGVVCIFRGQELLVGNRALLAQRAIAADRPQPEEGQAEVFVARSGRLIGTIRFADGLRPEAETAVSELRALGLRIVLLTGDASAVAHAVGRKLHIDEVQADLLPEQKQAYVEALQRSGRVVAMVGDGVNDAPALVQASVGVAMGSGAHVATESADVVLIGNDLGKLVETIRIARRCRRLISQNFIGTLAVDGAGVVLAAFGLLNPLLAAFIHVASELAFILNSTRLLPRGGGARPGLEPGVPLQLSRPVSHSIHRWG